MSVYQPRGTDRYVYEFQIKGRRYRGPCDTTDRTTAKRVERAARTKIEAGLQPDAASEMTIDAACARWFDEVGQHQKSAKNWERSLDLIILCVGARVKLKQITTATVAEAVRQRRLIPAEFKSRKGVKTRAVKASTVNRQIVELLRAILRRAQTVWGAQSLPVINWREVRQKEGAPRERELSDDEYTRLGRSALRDYWGEYYRFLGTYGLRLGEMQFKPDDVYEVDGAVSIRIRERKDGSTYTIDLDAEDGRLMLARKSRAEAAELPVCWFREVRGMDGPKLEPLTYSAARSALRRMIKRSGVRDLTIHDLRHDVATKVTRANGIEVAQALLGHADIATTKRYVKVSRADRLRGVAVMKSRGIHRDVAPDDENSSTKQKDAV